MAFVVHCLIAQPLSEVSDDKKPAHTKFFRTVVPDHLSTPSLTDGFLIVNLASGQ
jgi:hypothetical protein